MQFLKAALFGATALISLVAAQSSVLKLTSYPSSVTAGQSYTITWDTTLNDPVTIILRKGTTNALDTIGTLTTTATGKSYTWQVDNNLKSGSDYAIQIVQGKEVNYSGQFPIQGSALTTYGSSTSSAASSVYTSLTGAMNTTTSSATMSGNSTYTATLTATNTGSTSARGSATGSSSASGSSTGAPTNAAVAFQNPVGLMLGAMAAVAYLQ